MTTSLLVPNTVGKHLNYRLEPVEALCVEVNVRLNLDLLVTSFPLDTSHRVNAPALICWDVITFTLKNMAQV